MSQQEMPHAYVLNDPTGVVAPRPAERATVTQFATPVQDTPYVIPTGASALRVRAGGAAGGGGSGRRGAAVAVAAARVDSPSGMSASKH